MNEAVIRTRAAEIAELVRSDLSPKAAQERLAEYHAGDIAAAAELLSAGERTKLFRTLDMDELADVFEYFEPENSAEYLKETDLGKTVLLIGKMETDAAADVLREFPKEKRNQLFELLDEELRRKLELIVSFDDDEIGSRMTTNYISISSGMTAAEATRALMDQAKENDNISILFVTAENGFFCGAVGLRELLTAEKHSEIKPLIQQSFPYVYSTEKRRTA